MTYKAYIDNIRSMTGKTPEDFRRAAKEIGLVTHGDLLRWLKDECGLRHGHANAVILYIRDPAAARKKIMEDARPNRRA